MSENKKAILKIDGKEIEVEITQEQFDEICPKTKKTGYERAEDNETYYYIAGTGLVLKSKEEYTSGDDNYYKYANYYSDETIAKNNARADTLMRQLRRFAVEHRENEFDWNNIKMDKFYVYYNYDSFKLDVSLRGILRGFGAIYFDTLETAELAIDTFKDELLWYFTEYKDSL